MSTLNNRYSRPLNAPRSTKPLGERIVIAFVILLAVLFFVRCTADVHITPKDEYGGHPY